MYVHNLSPTLFSIGPVEVRYYSLAYIIGFILAYWVLYRAAESKSVKGLTKKVADDLVMWLVIGTVVGGRLGYFLFYHLDVLFSDPLEVLFIWHGGMAFHGGLLGCVIVTYWFVKKHGLSFYKLADLLVIPAAIALGLGRVANFVNGELVGTVTDVSWCVQFPDFEGCRHPVQIYTALKNFAVAGILYFQNKSERKDGYLFWSFVFWYALGRFLIEFWRVGTFYIFGLSMEQWLTLLMALAGAYVLFKKN